MTWRMTTLAAALTFASCNCGPGTGGYLIFDGSEISTPTVWSGTVEVQNSFSITSSLTVEKCTKILMPPGGQITVRDNGTIKTQGTADCPVVIQSVKTAPAAGDWNRIELYASSSNDTKFTHTHFLHADGSSYGVVWVENRATVGFENVTFEAITDTSIQLEAEARVSTFSGVKFVKTGREVMLVGGDLVGALTPMTATDTPEARVVVTSNVTKAATWKNLTLPIEVPSLDITAPLQVEAGAVLKMAPETVVAVRDGGGLRLLGTAASPISLESSKSTPAAGDWRRIDLYNTSQADNLFRNVTVRHGGDTSYGVLWLESTASVTLESTVFSSNSSCDVGVDGTVTDTGSTFVRCQ